MTGVDTMYPPLFCVMTHHNHSFFSLNLCRFDFFHLFCRVNEKNLYHNHSLLPLCYVGHGAESRLQ